MSYGQISLNTIAEGTFQSAGVMNRIVNQRVEYMDDDIRTDGADVPP